MEKSLSFQYLLKKNISQAMSTIYRALTSDTHEFKYKLCHLLTGWWWASWLTSLYILHCAIKESIITLKGLLWPLNGLLQHINYFVCIRHISKAYRYSDHTWHMIGILWVVTTISSIITSISRLEFVPRMGSWCLRAHSVRSNSEVEQKAREAQIHTSTHCSSQTLLNINS